MSIIFKPNGTLDIATEPTDIPQSIDKTGTIITSEGLTRCKNLRLDQRGKVKTRDGSSTFNDSAIDTNIYLLIEQGGYRYAFAGDEIYQDEVSIESGLTQAQWSAIKYRAYNETTQQIFALNGTDRKRIAETDVYNWGIAAPTLTPDIDIGVGSGLTGDYNAKYTFLRKSGSLVICESNGSSEGTAETLADGSLYVWCPGPGDVQVTHIRLYRTSTNGLLYNVDLDGTLPDVVTDGVISHDWEDDYLTDSFQFTTYDVDLSGTYTYSWETDTTTDTRDEIMSGTHRFEGVIFDTDTLDASLGSEIETDHNQPPLGSFVFGPAYNGTCFIIKNSDLYYCKPKQPEYWPLTYYIEVSTPQFHLQTGLFHNAQPYVLSKNEVFYIQGTGHGSFFPLPMKARTGSQGPFGAISVRGQGIYHTGPDGIYLFSGDDKKITETTLEPLFRGETVQGMPGVSDNLTTAWLHYFKNKIYVGYTSTGYSYPTNVLVIYLDSNRVGYFNYNNIEIRCITTDETNVRLIIGDNTGYVRKIEDSSLTTDSGTSISWEVQSKEYTLQTRRHFPRYIKYDVDVNDSTVTGSVILDGVTHQTHTITGTRVTKRRLIDTGNGRRCQMNIAGTGPATVYMSEME